MYNDGSLVFTDDSVVIVIIFLLLNVVHVLSKPVLVLVLGKGGCINRP